MLDISPEVDDLIDLALSEDRVFNDATTSALLTDSDTAVGVIRAKTDGIVAGINVALAVFRRLDVSVGLCQITHDGDILSPGADIARIHGKVSTILRGERTALNFLQRMSGIATETNKYVEAVKDFSAQIVDTRKTVPGFRYLDKYAIRAGGGRNHRMDLSDGILIKDNHIEILRHRGLGLLDVLKLAMRQAAHTLKVEVEIANLDQLEEALKGGAHIIMLDNMSIENMAKAVCIVDGRAVLEASGGITIGNVRDVAATGVDIISIGALTHSVIAMDISLDLEP
ncbi:carboxylating nicotinate-nucleotide diphosphorylase [SAR202 cluster bacterium AD-804-J14_MRT_500m]|nr:carboxylating nicotinate-nucleotide diphosphorylase [SAR202 cluster bacterium AD-804-J14_MRT_500m]